MRCYCVYKHTAPNGKVYIGITCRDPQKRWNNGNGYYQNKHFSAAIRKYGWDNIQHDILENGLTKEQACESEKRFIKQYKSDNKEYGYNNSSGGEYPCEGHKHTDETKEKQRAAHIGVKKSEETKKRMSEAQKGRDNKRTGKIGIDAPQAKLYLQIDPKTGAVIKVWYGSYEVVRECGYTKSRILEAATGKRKTAYGYKWKQIERGDQHVPIF